MCISSTATQPMDPKVQRFCCITEFIFIYCNIDSIQPTLDNVPGKIPF